MNIRILTIVCVLLYIAACNSPSSNKAHSKNEISDLNKEATKVEEVPQLPSITYQLVSPKAITDTDSIRLDILLSLNRVDMKHFNRADSVVVPDTFFTNKLLYSPFPLQVNSIKEVKKILFYSYRIEAFGAYEYGQLVRWGPVSLGKKATPTATGLFHTNWKSKKTTSTVDDEWVMEWYFNLDNREGVSMHQYELPGYPASHACARLAKEDAIWFYTWCQQWITNDDRTRSIKAYGTPVIVYGSYAFGQKRPWLTLPDNKDVLKMDEDSIDKEVRPFINTILQRQATRDSITALKPSDRSI